MAMFDQDKVFDALAIRDQNNHNSIVSNNQSTPTKTIAVCNKLNQIVTCQLQGSFEEAFTEVFNIGTSFNVGIGLNGSLLYKKYYPCYRDKVAWYYTA